MNHTLEVKVVNVFGRESIYPVCERAKIFADMLGQTTLTRSNIANIKKLGYSFQVQQQGEI